MLDVECSVRGFPDTYVQKVKVQHKENRKLFEPKHCDINRTFGIHHYAGQVVYDTSDFLDTNRDVIPDDLVGIFARYIGEMKYSVPFQNCTNNDTFEIFHIIEALASLDLPLTYLAMRLKHWRL